VEANVIVPEKLGVQFLEAQKMMHLEIVLQLVEVMTIMLVVACLQFLVAVLIVQLVIVQP
jgi:hypothetical protein